MPLHPLIERSVMFTEQSATLKYMDKVISKIKKSIILRDMARTQIQYEILTKGELLKK